MLVNGYGKVMDRKTLGNHAKVDSKSPGRNKESKSEKKAKGNLKVRK